MPKLEVTDEEAGLLNRALYAYAQDAEEFSYQLIKMNRSASDSWKKSSEDAHNLRSKLIDMMWAKRDAKGPVE